MTNDTSQQSETSTANKGHPAATSEAVTEAKVLGMTVGDDQTAEVRFAYFRSQGDRQAEAYKKVFPKEAQEKADAIAWRASRFAARPATQEAMRMMSGAMRESIFDLATKAVRIAQKQIEDKEAAGEKITMQEMTQIAKIVKYISDSQQSGSSVEIKVAIFNSPDDRNRALGRINLDPVGWRIVPGSDEMVHLDSYQKGMAAAAASEGPALRCPGGHLRDGSPGHECAILADMGRDDADFNAAHKRKNGGGGGDNGGGGE